MKLIKEILEELGADDGRAFTVIPSSGAYFKSVLSVNEYAPEKVVLVLKKLVITAEGEGLEIDKFFERDIFIKGDIKVIKID